MKNNEKVYWLAGDSYPSCHDGPVQIEKNLFCGSERDFIAAAKAKVFVDTLVPLCSLDGEIWQLGFRGEILYYPIEDFGTLPNAVLDSLVTKVMERLRARKKVGLFCMGGHGRTGYVASIILGKLGHKDPIEVLRECYCFKAVESSAQIGHIAKYLGKPELVGRHGTSVFDRLDAWEPDSFRVLPRGFGQLFTCGSCDLSAGGVCFLFERQIEEDDAACRDYIEHDTDDG